MTKGSIREMFRVVFLVLGIVVVFVAAGGILIFLSVNATSLTFDVSPDAARDVVMSMLFVWIVLSLVFSIILVKNHSKE